MQDSFLTMQNTPFNTTNSFREADHLGNSCGRLVFLVMFLFMCFVHRTITLKQLMSMTVLRVYTYKCWLGMVHILLTYFPSG